MAAEINGMAPLLMVYDLPASLSFYCDKLGFTLANSDAYTGSLNWALLRLGDITLMINNQYELKNRPPSPEQARKKHHGDTFLYFNHPDIPGLYHELLAKSLSPTAPHITVYGWDAFELEDPDGFQLIFHCPRK
jgi:glyoxylase I family protein